MAEDVKTEIRDGTLYLTLIPKPAAQTVEHRVVHFTIDPALEAYLFWIDSEGREFRLGDFDLFAAGYRAERIGEASDAGQ